MKSKSKMSVRQEEVSRQTRGHVLDWGWRYDLMLWWSNLLLLGKWRALEQQIVELIQAQPGERVLDVGCGTGVLALHIAAHVGATGQVCGIDPGPKQIARARKKAVRVRAPISFQVGVIEQLPFPDQSFDLVLTTFVMHMLPDDLKQQGLGEIARVLKPAGRLLLVDTKRPEEQGEHQERPVHTGPFHSGIQDQPLLLREAGFVQIESGDLAADEHRLPAIGFVKARTSQAGEE
jgi:ubiquinone/menaquinone biosynthesis C-methylase UbiE